MSLILLSHFIRIQILTVRFGTKTKKRRIHLIAGYRFFSSLKGYSTISVASQPAAVDFFIIRGQDDKGTRNNERNMGLLIGVFGLLNGESGRRWTWVV